MKKEKDEKQMIMRMIEKNRKETLMKMEEIEEAK